MDVAALLRAKGHGVVVIDPERSVADAVALLEQYDIGALIVSSDRLTVAGVISERDVVRRLARDGPACLADSVGAVATADVTTCGPDELADRVMVTMTEGRFRHMPVVDGGQLVGLISIGDVVKHRVAELEQTNSHLETYIAGVPR